LFRGNLYTFPLNLQENVRLQTEYNSLMKANWYQFSATTPLIELFTYP